MALERLQRTRTSWLWRKSWGFIELLYRWREQLAPACIGDEPPPENSRESMLRKEVSQLKRVLAEKTV
jgi:hypothetical protein